MQTSIIYGKNKNEYFTIGDSLNEEKLKSLIRKGVVNATTAATIPRTTVEEITDKFNAAGKKYSGLDYEKVANSGLDYVYDVYVLDDSFEGYRIQGNSCDTEANRIDKRFGRPGRTAEVYEADADGNDDGRLKYYETLADAQNAAEEISKALDCAIIVYEMEMIYDNGDFDYLEGNQMENIYYRGVQII